MQCLAIDSGTKSEIDRNLSEYGFPHVKEQTLEKYKTGRSPPKPTEEDVGLKYGSGRTKNRKKGALDTKLHSPRTVRDLVVCLL